MAITFIPSSEIGEVSLTSGTGTYTITGRNITNCFEFADFLTAGDRAYFTIGDGAQLEWITGTYNGTTISRDIIWKSTSGGAAVDWPSTGQRFIRLAAASDTDVGPVPLGVGTVTNTGALTDHALIVGNGGIDVSALSSLGTSTTVLHGNATGDPTFGPVSLTADVTDTLSVDHGGIGTTTLATGLPLFGAGTSAITTGTLSGNTTKLASTTGTLTNTHLAIWDASGNLIDGGVGGTVTSTGTLTSGAMILGNAGVDVIASTHMTEQSGYYQYTINTAAAPGSPFNGSYFCSVDGGTTAAFIDVFAAVGSFTARRFGGTNASKAATEAGVAILTLAARGYGTGTTTDRATVELRTVNLWSGIDHSTQIFFRTTPTGSTTNAKRAQIKDGFTAGTGTTDNGIGTVTGENGVFDASTRLYGIGNAFTAVSGPTTSTKAFALPDASATVLTTNALVTVPQGGTGAGTLGSGLPLLGAGTSAITTGTLAGNTTKLATTSGTLTNTHLAVWDASGNLIDGGAVPSGGSGTVTNTGTLTAGAMILGNAGVDLTASAHMTEQSGYYQYTINTAAAPGSPFNGSYFCSIDNGQAAFFMDTFAAVASVMGRRYGGTNASKAATEANSTILTIAARGYDTAATTDRAQIQLRSVNLWSGTDNSTEIFFNTTPSASRTIAKRAQIKDGFTAGTGTTDNGIGTVTGENGIFDASTRLYGVGNAFTTFTGPTTSTKTFTLPDASSTLATLSGTEQLDNKTLPLLNLGDPGTKLTIASGVITVTRSYHLVDTQAAAATDDLDTINGAVSIGHIVVLQTFLSTRDVTVKNGTGNIFLGTAGDCALTLIRHSITLVWNGSDWTEIARTV